ncbi:MAG TPA: ABC transporter permease [Candidatus Eisenbergiella stercoravium]|nr:ABC transporter permease [Candidatus Eisenbergiella stercoravium]
MRKLVFCELFKYRRNKIIPALTSLALLFPAALIFLTKSSLNGAETLTEFHAYYDSLFNNNLVYSSMLLLPGLTGCVGAVLFFTERDCGAFKNLRVIPVTEKELIFAKLITLYLWSVFYSVCSTAAMTLFCFLLEPAALYDVFFKLLCGILTGITMTTVSLPAAVIVIYINQGRFLSLLLSFLYSVVNWLLLILFASNDGVLRWLPLLNGLLLSSRLWGWRKASLGMGEELTALPFQEYVFTALYLLFSFLICTFLIIRFYKKWSR